jgi:hypothetical protein
VNEAQKDYLEQHMRTNILKVAEAAELIVPPDRVLCALLSAAASYATTRNLASEIVDLLRQAAARLTDSEPPPLKVH